SLEDSQRMQTDTVSTHARKMIPLLTEVHAVEPREEQALAMLRKWDGNDSRDSAAAAIFEVWFSKHLKAAVLRQQLGESGAKLATPGDNMRILMALADPVVMPLAERNALIISSLKNALDEIAAKLGP